MVVPAVKVPGEADDLALSGECARHTQRQVRRLCSGHCEPHSLRGWNQALDLLGPLDLQGMARSVMRTLRGLPDDRVHDRRMIVPENQRAVPTEIVHILVAIHVPLA
jgi:hypothetical protein